MSLADELLEQARHLATRERVHPKQASLRRAVSAAYYALFHLLIDEATSTLVAVQALHARFARGFAHADMKDCSKAYASLTPSPAQLANLSGGLAIPAELQQVASAFVELQEARHEADYNVGIRFTRMQVNDLVALADAAFVSWQAVRTDPVAPMYLAALLLWKKGWNRG